MNSGLGTGSSRGIRPLDRSNRPLDKSIGGSRGPDPPEASNQVEAVQEITTRMSNQNLDSDDQKNQP